MQSSNLHDCYAQLLHWCKSVHERTKAENQEAPALFPWEEKFELLHEVEVGLLQEMQRPHAKRIAQYRSEGILGSREEAAQTTQEALRDLFGRLEQGDYVADPLGFLQQAAWEYYLLLYPNLLRLHPEAAYPELSSPEYERLRDKTVKWLMYRFQVDEDAADDVFGHAIKKVLDYVKEGKPFTHSLKNYLRTIAWNKMLPKNNKFRNENLTDFMPSDQDDEDNPKGYDWSNHTEGKWQPALPALDDAMYWRDFAAAVPSALQHIENDTYREALLLKFGYLFNGEFIELSNEEIAAKLEITKETLKVRLSLARKDLNAQLVALGFDRSLTQKGSPSDDKVETNSKQEPKPKGKPNQKKHKGKPVTQETDAPPNPSKETP